MDAASIQPHESPATPPRRWRRRLVILLVVVTALILLGQTPLLPYYISCGPQSVTQARFLCPITLPDGAKNVQYQKLVFLVAHEEYVRFEAPVDVCLAHIPTVIQQHNQAHPPLRQVASAATQPLEPLAKRTRHRMSVPAWFDMESTDQGVWAGSSDPMQPIIWVDTKNGVFYYLLTD